RDREKGKEKGKVRVREKDKAKVREKGKAKARERDRAKAKGKVRGKDKDRDRGKDKDSRDRAIPVIRLASVAREPVAFQSPISPNADVPRAAPIGVPSAKESVKP
ncbi:MAG: hypothetical protein QF473_22360, partial [Planctomycetota bacterium]|nr:hypothetical protein [Planctomycetota bacterium]